MTTHELSAAFVGDVATAAQNGRLFVAFKKPTEPRNTLFEVNLTNWTLAPIGVTPGVWYKDGGCSLTFDKAGQLVMLNTCSPDPSTGGAARVVIWETGITCGPLAGGIGDGLVRTALRAVRAALVPLGVV